MYIIQCGVEGTTMYAQPYVFLEPARLWVVHPNDDDMQLMGYGIGDIIKVMEPSVCYAVACYDEKPFLTLEDGSIAYKYGTGEWPKVGRA